MDMLCESNALVFLEFVEINPILDKRNGKTCGGTTASALGEIFYSGGFAMTVKACYALPHPPIMLREIGGLDTQRVESSIRACERVAKEIKDISPDTVVIISPHGPVFQDALCLYDFPLKGSFKNFRAPQVSMEFNRDHVLKKEILKIARQNKIPVVTTRDVPMSKYGFEEELDHGVTVPMYFISKETADFELLPIAFGMLPYEELYDFGRLIARASESVNKKVVIIASSDLSHRLTRNAPAGYDPLGKVFDERLVSLLEKFDLPGLLALEPSLIESAGECGLRSIWIMAGTLDGHKVKSEVLSYEGPFGVGYCIARFEPKGETSSMLDDLIAVRQNKIKEERAKESVYVKLARNTLENKIRHGYVPDMPDDLPQEMFKNRAGVFVTIKKYGELRGCIGTFLPTENNIAEEIQRNAISAGCQDPRFDPVEAHELPELSYSVDVLTKPEPVDSLEELDPKRYGVIVKKGFRSGLLLPDLEGVNTVEEQIDIALQKAGIYPDEDYELERFSVIRYN